MTAPAHIIPISTTSYGWPLCPCCGDQMMALPNERWACSSAYWFQQYINNRFRELDPASMLTGNYPKEESIWV